MPSGAITETIPPATDVVSAVVHAARGIVETTPGPSMVVSHVAGTFIWVKVDDVPPQAFVQPVERVGSKVFGQSLRPKRPKYAERPGP